MESLLIDPLAIFFLNLDKFNHIKLSFLSRKLISMVCSSSLSKTLTFPLAFNHWIDD